MTRDDIIRMAREAGLWPAVTDTFPSEVERFADLVAAAVRNQTWTRKHWTDYERAIEAAEREACAKVCEDIDAEYEGEDVLATWCAAAIRARGQA